MTPRTWSRPPGSPTVTQIARAAGVPVPVVSKVLNGRSDVSTTIRVTVAHHLRQAGYTLAGPGSAAGAVTQLDLVVSGVEGTWANTVLSGVEGVASQTGLDVVVVVAQDTTPPEHDWVQRLVDRGSRGAVLALVAPSVAQLRRLRAGGVRLVALDPHRMPPAGMLTVGATNWTGGRHAAEHLLALGHTRIAAIGGDPHHHYSQARLDGFRSALAAHGVVESGAGENHGHWTRSGAAEVAQRLLDQTAPPTAVFACSDRMALGVFDAAAARGLRIPEDLSVVGFDDLPEARWLSPALTTIGQPVREMAGLATQTLLRLMAGEEVAVRRVELETELVERASTCPPRPAAQKP